jgi:spermidine/putrescine transport system ATP-binding protein
VIYKLEYDVELINITKKYGSTPVLSNISLSVRSNEFFSILGPSGSGKTTILRIIAGLTKPDDGIVKIKGVDVTSLPPYRRRVGMVFQHLALFPHLTVFENIAYSLRIMKMPEDDVRRRVKEYLEIVNLPYEVYAGRKINQLSGGQQQRVAIARALIMEPKVLLLDEPLGSLDFKLRQHMMLELKRLQRTVGTTFIYVTHDQEEALIMSDRIAVLNNGRIEQIGSPSEIYGKPKNKFVASFIGEANFITGKLVSDEVFVGSFGYVKIPKVNTALNGRAVLSIRPERIRVGLSLNGLDNIYKGEIEEKIYTGSYVYVKVRVSVDTCLKCLVPVTDIENLGLNEGMNVAVGWNKQDIIGVFED